MSSRPWPSRISRSSSQGQIGPFSRAMPVLPPGNDAVALRAKTPRFPAPSRAAKIDAASFHGRRERHRSFGQDHVRVQPRSRDIFEISEIENSKTTMTTTKKIDDSFGGFLRECALCHKKLKENDDKYMYGFLGAFCSPGCREDKIIIDGFDKQFPPEAVMKMIKIPRSKIIMAPRRKPLSDDDSDDLSD